MPVLRLFVYWALASVSLVQNGWAQMVMNRAGVKYVLLNTNTVQIHFFGVSNTNANTPAKKWWNTNTNTNTAHQVQIQIHIEAEIKLLPFCGRYIQIHSIVRIFLIILISLKAVSKGEINNTSTLVHLIARHWVGDKPLSEPMMARFTEA